MQWVRVSRFAFLLEYLGVYDESLFVSLDPQAFDVLHFPERDILFPQGYAAVITELTSHFPAEKDAIAQYFALVKSVSNRFPTYRYSDSPDLTFPPEALDLSLKHVVERLTSDQRLQSVFYAYCSLHGVRPGDVAFGFHAIVTDSLIEGPYGLKHSGDALTAKFTAEIRRYGGEILTRRRVTALEVDGQRHLRRVVCEGGQSYSAEWVISSLHPKATFAMNFGARYFSTGVSGTNAQHAREPSEFLDSTPVCNKAPRPFARAESLFFSLQ